MGLAFSLLVELALGVAHSETRNGDRVAPKRFRIYWTWKSHHAAPGRPTVTLEVRDLIRKMSLANPLLGSTAYPWGVAQTGNRIVPGHCREVYGSPAKAALSDLAHFSQQSREGTRLYRLLRGADPELSSFVCLHSLGPLSAPSDSFQRYCPSQLGMDGTTNCRGLPLGHCSTLVSWPAMLENSLRWVFGVSGRPFRACCMIAIRSMEIRFARECEAWARGKS